MEALNERLRRYAYMELARVKQEHISLETAVMSIEAFADGIYECLEEQKNHTSTRLIEECRADIRAGIKYHFGVLPGDPRKTNNALIALSNDIRDAMQPIHALEFRRIMKFVDDQSLK